jgi:uncharacterized phage protein (TIGR01671 family)
MREIKFRAWHLTEKRFIDVRNIDFEYDKIGYDSHGEFNYSELDFLDRVVLQQYTGLKDSNNKEIYEGDIMASRGNYVTDEVDSEGNYLDLTNVVVWNKRNSRFGLTEAKKYFQYINKERDCPDLSYVWTCYITTFREVIGNIFETPELIEEIENSTYHNGIYFCKGCSGRVISRLCSCGTPHSNYKNIN